ncbi:MAG: vWA domain-containing protein [Planctomycetota bacterium]
MVIKQIPVLLFLLAAIVAPCLPASDGGAPATPAAATMPPAGERAVDLVLCLDTSGSMQGLIDAARQKLWAIVNDLALAKPTPRLRVALLTYGNDGHPAEVGWVKIETPLTDDLDLVSRRLFEQTTNGGTELVARVLQKALDSLGWTASEESLKLIFVAGNESADQDQQVSFRDVCKRAIERGIMVNSIYCGNPMDEIAPAWREVATLADGHFAAIDQNSGTVVIETPFDEELAALSGAVNATYLPFGAGGEAGGANQVAQDANAKNLSKEAAAARAVTKGQSLYRCNWDLVDACAKGQVKLEDLKDEDLPESMRKLTVEERRKFLQEMGAKRSEVQAKIQAAAKKRQDYITAQLAKGGLDDEKSFDHAVRSAVRAQACRKGFEFEEGK